MILWGNEENWYPFVNTVKEIKKQDPKQNGAQSLVIVLLLAEKRKTKIKEIIEKLKTEVKDMLSEGYIQLVVSKSDTDPEYFEKIKNNVLRHVNDETSLMNYRLAFLFKYCSGVADHVMLLDSEATITQTAMKTIYKEMDEMQWNTLYIDLGSENIMHKIFQGRYLPRIYGTFYALAQLGIQTSIMNSIADSSVHTKKKQYKGTKLIEAHISPVHENPPASVTSKLQIFKEHNAEQLYLNKGAAWFITPKTGDHITVTLNEPTKLTKIYIEAGLDSFKRDIFNRGVLELSYGKDIGSNQCTQFEAVASFWTTSVVRITNDDEKNSIYLNKQIHCIRIKVTEDFLHWGSLKKFIIQKAN